MKKNYELNFLRSLEEGKEVTQKSISDHISVSIGFVNALIKKFLNKGVIKVRQAPYKRFILQISVIFFLAFLSKSFITNWLNRGFLNKPTNSDLKVANQKR